MLMVLVAGCASQPEALPPAQPMPAPVVCQVPAGMTVGERAPARPRGEYTQRDVAAYLVELHRWGAAGWARLRAVETWSDGCVQRERLRASQPAGGARD